MHLVGSFIPSIRSFSTKGYSSRPNKAWKVGSDYSHYLRSKGFKSSGRALANVQVRYHSKKIVHPPAPSILYPIPQFQIFKSISSFDKQEMALMEKSISEGVINAMTQFCNKHENLQGIWYPDDYKKCLKNELGMEMEESFYSGYANEKYFERAGHYTFKIKEGKKASEALFSFLEGPHYSRLRKCASSLQL